MNRYRCTLFDWQGRRASVREAILAEGPSQAARALVEFKGDITSPKQRSISSRQRMTVNGPFLRFCDGTLF